VCRTINPMTSLINLCRRVWAVGHPTEVPKSSDAIRIGLFGASAIAYALLCLLQSECMLKVIDRPAAIILPAKSHPDVIIAAIAARDERKAQAYAKKHGIPKVHKSYQGM
jgi:predicted dehydrogenase